MTGHVMRGFWLGFLAVGFGLAAPVDAAELKGFGPIGFGMTRDEAFMAVGGKGTWHSKRELRYEMNSDRLFSSKKLFVTQEFENGRAATVRVQAQEFKLPRFSCVTTASVVAGIISEKYGIRPITRNDVWLHYKPASFESDETSDLYTFGFADNAYIQINATWSTKKAICKILLVYSPPLRSPIRF